MTSQIVSWIASHGVYAVFVLMAIDAVLPAGGEIVMLFAGALAAGAVAGHHVALFGAAIQHGVAGFLVMVAAGTLGYLAGSLLGWTLGRRGGRPLLERHGRWLHLGPARLVRAERWFDRFGPAAVFLGRLTPLVRSFISIPAGVLGSPLPLYTLLTFVASAIWCLAFAGAGWALGSRWENVHHAFRYVDYAIAGLIVCGVVALAWRLRRARAGVRAG